MKTDLDLALYAARTFGLEAKPGPWGPWSKDDRPDIASHYGAQNWKDIPIEHRNLLLAAYRLGERQGRAKSLSERLFVEVTKEWEPADWDETSPEKLKLSIEEFLDGGNIKRSLEETVWAFEEWMGW